MLAVSVMAMPVLPCWQLLSYCLISTTATELRGALSPLSHHVVLASDSAISKTYWHRLTSRQAAGGQCPALIFIKIDVIFIKIKVAARPPKSCVVIFIKLQWSFIKIKN